MGTKGSSVPVLAAVLATRYSRLVLLASWAGASSKRTCPQLPPATGAAVLVVYEPQQHKLMMGWKVRAVEMQVKQINMKDLPSFLDIPAALGHLGGSTGR